MLMWPMTFPIALALLCARAGARRHVKKSTSGPATHKESP